MEFDLDPDNASPSFFPVHQQSTTASPAPAARQEAEVISVAETSSIAEAEHVSAPAPKLKSVIVAADYDPR